MEFNQNFIIIKGDTLTLKLIETCVGDDKVIPFYYYDVYLNSLSSAIGKISIRIGHNEHSYINGNVGYEIEETFRGYGYAKLAVEMTYEIAKFHGMTHLIISCGEDNHSSKRVINKLGGIHIETIAPPKNYVFYYDGIPKHSIYRIDI
ncbi:MAG: GNAT family N-acetyltransferase [Acholeplasmataceae bacterium]|jgi:predicted acetyltransferase|nr:GNAT family N-acetyltransferase [Acholeplasmataceae bacterium]